MAFSCPRRRLCPSCHQKRSLLIAAHIAREVWVEASAGDPWTLNVYAIDTNGNLLDWDNDGMPH